MTNSKIEVNAEDLRFVTDEGMFAWIRMVPPTEPDNFGAWQYNVEIAWEPDAKNTSFKNAVAKLVESVTGKKGFPKTLIQKLEDTNKDPDKNAHLQGKIFSSFKKRVNPKERNLTDPEERKKWLAYVETMQPGLYKLNDKGQREAASAGDFYSGCYGKVIGHCYYQAEYKKYCVTADYVILTKKGERIGGGPIDPDADELLNATAPKATDVVDQMLSSSSDSDIEELPF